jgi:hypothetical protein
MPSVPGELLSGKRILLDILQQRMQRGCFRDSHAQMPPSLLRGFSAPWEIDLVKAYRENCDAAKQQAYLHTSYLFTQVFTTVSGESEAFFAQLKLAEQGSQESGDVMLQCGSNRDRLLPCEMPAEKRIERCEQSDSERND